MRLDFYVSHAEGMSRKDAKINITKGRVEINGTVIKKANHQVKESDELTLDDVVLSWPTERYYLLHKPVDYVCATQDDEHPIVLDLLPVNLHKDLKVVGRLDKDTTGLLLLTTDGQWLHRITSPKHECSKTYLVHLSYPIDQQAVTRLMEGVMLNGEAAPTRPAKVEIVTETCIRLTIQEGKYHQVKRMLAAVENHVVALHRESIGNVRLDETLALGEFRALTPKEVDSLN
ncbi:pseudouridine synthase [Marinomonas algicola]|uniref:pseudouridine synthase n=1 Tax=Marinomonas algicola TaxID=2773454 RepID=UPI00174E1DAB|nr:pseudouridine synthase [Marinomonas algicola]